MHALLSVWYRRLPFLQDSNRARHILVALIAIVSLAALSGCQQVRDADHEYEQTLEQIDSIQEYLGEREIYELTPEDMSWLEDEFRVLSQRVDNMEDASSLPLGLDRAAELGSARYRAMMEMLEVAGLLAESGQIIANIGNEAMTALDESGIRFDSDVEGETWLEVIHRRDSELDDALLLMDEALTKRNQLDESELPGRVQGNLYQIDQMIERFEGQIKLADQRPMAYEALGIDEKRGYLVLFQNPTELRPTGGFVGTIALLELHRGQISSYEFQDVYEVSSAYDRQSSHSVDPPWAISEYVRSDKLQFQDANWWPNFPDSASLLLEMSEAAGWPEVHGIAAVQPETIQDLIDVTGPIELDVDGERRTITSDNLLEESERQRRIQRETGQEEEIGHKEVIELIGDVLIDQLSQGDRDDLIPAVLMVFDRLDQRDMQAYHKDDDVQQFLEERNWAGMLEPESDVPTLAAIFANVTGLKTSLAMQPSMHLDLQPGESELLDVTMTLSLEHTGEEGGDPFYEGFQRYWVDVHLPEDATFTEASVPVSDDPGASSGGAYVVDLHVGTTESIVVEFSMPSSDRLLLRRQPGLTTMAGTVDYQGCNDTLEFQGDMDTTILLGSDCPAIEWDPEE